MENPSYVALSRQMTLRRADGRHREQHRERLDAGLQGRAHDVRASALARRATRARAAAPRAFVRRRSACCATSAQGALSADRQHRSTSRSTAPATSRRDAERPALHPRRPLPARRQAAGRHQRRRCPCSSAGRADPRPPGDPVEIGTGTATTETGEGRPHPRRPLRGRAVAAQGRRRPLRTTDQEPQPAEPATRSRARACSRTRTSSRSSRSRRMMEVMRRYQRRRRMIDRSTTSQRRAIERCSRVG